MAIGDTYTKPYTNTSQGLDYAKLMETLGSITGGVNPQAKQFLQQAGQLSQEATTQQLGKTAYEQSQRAGFSQAGQFPQATESYGDLAKQHQLFIADQNMAKQYMRPDVQAMGVPTQQASDVATYGSVGVPNAPIMTGESLTQPFQGFTDPSMAARGAYIQSEGIVGMANALKSLIDFNYSSAKNTLQRNLDAEQNQIEAKKYSADKLFDAFWKLLEVEQDRAKASRAQSDEERDYQLKLREQMRKEAEGGQRYNPETGQYEYLEGVSDPTSAFVEQVKGGMKLESVPQDYRARVVTKLTQQGFTTDKLDKLQEANNVMPIIMSLKNFYNDNNLSLGNIAGRASKVAAKIDQNSNAALYLRLKKGFLATLKDLVKEKGNLSNLDIERLDGLLPDIILDKSFADKNWAEIEKILKTKYGEDEFNEIINKKGYAPNQTNNSGGWRIK